MVDTFAQAPSSGSSLPLSALELLSPNPTTQAKVVLMSFSVQSDGSGNVSSSQNYGFTFTAIPMVFLCEGQSVIAGNWAVSNRTTTSFIVSGSGLPFSTSIILQALIIGY